MHGGFHLVETTEIPYDDRFLKILQYVFRNHKEKVSFFYWNLDPNDTTIEDLKNDFYDLSDRRMEFQIDSYIVHIVAGAEKLGKSKYSKKHTFFVYIYETFSDHDHCMIITKFPSKVQKLLEKLLRVSSKHFVEKVKRNKMEKDWIAQFLLNNDENNA